MVLQNKIRAQFLYFQEMSKERELNSEGLDRGEKKEIGERCLNNNQCKSGNCRKANKDALPECRKAGETSKK